MFHTRNDLPETTRQNVIGLLQARLADSISVMLQSKQAHWNVKGPQFIALHELFDKINEEMETAVDLIAERIAQFGGIAEGTCEAVTKNTTMPIYPLTIRDGQKHVEALSHSLASFGEVIRQAIDQAADWDDVGTADILTEISRMVDKNLWFVESHGMESSSNQGAEESKPSAIQRFEARSSETRFRKESQN